MRIFRTAPVSTLALPTLALLLLTAPAQARDAAQDQDLASLAPVASLAPAQLPTDPLELALARWIESAAPRRDAERLADPLAGLACSTPPRIELRLEAGSPDLLALPRPSGPPLVSDVLGELPILSRAWALANDLVPASAERLRDLTLELGGASLLPDALRDWGGAVARGPYSRTDDSDGGSFTVDVRVVLSWRPHDSVHLEAGYSIAYAGGEYGAQLDGQSGRRAEFMRHGPWAAVGLDF